MPGLPKGKPAGTPCPHLDEALRCRLFGQAERPPVCSSLMPSADMCGETREQAMRWLGHMETLTSPGDDASAHAPSVGAKPSPAEPGR